MAVTASDRKALQSYVRTLDRDIQNELQRYIKQAILAGSSIGEIRKASKELAKSLRAIYRESAKVAIETGSAGAKTMAIKYAKKVEAVSGLQKSKVDAMVGLDFGGGLEKKVLDAVWNKVWPDSQTVEDRINRLTSSARIKAEQIMRSGIEEGLSAQNIAKEMALKLDIERKAAFRLAAHTTNMAYHEANAEIAMDMSFIMGIRIMRGVLGPASETCDICEEHGGPADGAGQEYLKSDFGGRDIDLWAMTNSPPYHPNCNCDLEYIEMDAAEFVQYAREKYGKGRGS